MSFLLYFPLGAALMPCGGDQCWPFPGIRSHRPLILVILGIMVHIWYDGTMESWYHGIMLASWCHWAPQVPIPLCLWLPRSGGRRVSWNGNQSLIFFLLSQRAKDFKAFSLRNSEAWWTFSVFFCVLETFNTLSFFAPSKTGTQLNGMYIWEPMKMCLRLRRQL